MGNGAFVFKRMYRFFYQFMIERVTSAKEMTPLKGRFAMAQTIKELLGLDDEMLFSNALKARKGKRPILWSPNVINSACYTVPKCRHCKWECFKKEDKMPDGRRLLDNILWQTEKIIATGAEIMLMPSGWMGYTVPDYFCTYIEKVKERFAITIYGLFGSIDLNSLLSLKQAGMEGYQCGLESPNELSYRYFRPGGDSIADRIQTMTFVKEAGLKLWSGFILAFGLSDPDIEKGIELLKSAHIDCLSIQPFVPYPHTALASESPTNPHYWARVTAAAGLCIPDCDLALSENDGAYAAFGGQTGANVRSIFLNETDLQQK
jgi:biotin synthase